MRIRQQNLDRFAQIERLQKQPRRGMRMPPQDPRMLNLRGVRDPRALKRRAQQVRERVPPQFQVIRPVKVEEILKEKNEPEKKVEEIKETAKKVEEDANLWKDFNGLTIENFKETVLDDKDNVWIVAFISPHCHSCHVLADDWKQLRVKDTVINRKIKFGYVDVSIEANREILDKHCGDNKIKYTPTVLLYGDEKTKPTEYSGDYSLDSIHDKACDFCDDEGFGLGELLKESKSKKKIQEEADEAAGIEVEESDEDKAKKKAIANGKKIVIVDDAALQEALKETRLAKKEEKEKEEKEEAEMEEKEKKEKKERKEKEEKEEKEEEDDGEKKIDVSKLDIDKPIVVNPKAAELPSHISSLQKIAQQVHRGDFDINDTAAEVELSGLGLYGGAGGLRPGAGLGYGTGYG